MNVTDVFVVGAAYLEYLVRRAGCRAFGHQWESECEVADWDRENYVTGYRCRRCHRTGWLA